MTMTVNIRTTKAALPATPATRGTDPQPDRMPNRLLAAHMLSGLKDVRIPADGGL
jgi:hypothetical protein